LEAGSGKHIGKKMQKAKMQNTRKNSMKIGGFSVYAFGGRPNMC
jgi:hypothetical protein